MLRTFARSWPMGLLALLGLAGGLAVPVAEGQDRTQARVITRAGPVEPVSGGLTRVPVDHDRPEGPQVVRRQVVEPAAVVSRALSEQPVLPHLVEVQLGGVTVLVDPQVDYDRSTGGLDENHTIRRAQRLHQAAQPSPPARVLRHPQAESTPPSDAKRESTPDAIFLRPKLQPSSPEDDILIVQGE